MKQSKDYFWSRNAYILDDQTINILFEELLWMSEEQITDWVLRVRKKVVDVWDKYETPPLNGKSKEEIIDEFSKMTGESVKHFQKKDELDGKNNVIMNNSVLGPACSQFFWTMMKVPIQHSSSKTNDGKFKGYSVYDIFKEDRFAKRMQLGFRRHFRRDSFYAYSISIPAESKMGIIPAKTGYDWIKFFCKNPSGAFNDYGFWLNPVEETEKGSGYTETDASKFLTVTLKELQDIMLWSNFKGPGVFNNIPNKQYKDEDKFAIRMYKKDIRIFPLGFRAFRIGYDNVAVNFPPMIAKFLFEKYTEHCKKQEIINIYDPSAGWGGRILGSMALNGDRHIHYVGTDPNTDNYIPSLNKTRYEYLASFFNNNTVSEAHNLFGLKRLNTFDIFQDGSEEIEKNKRFQKYKGKLDLVFTSPPYFNKEFYASDETQSCVKFSTYETWRDGFLRPTLETAVKYLKKDRYLLWNIADINCNGALLPLEQDSKDILKSLGMQFKGIEKMALASMPGANRIGEDGKPTAKNFCKIKGRWIKFEPIFVFYKP